MKILILTIGGSDTPLVKSIESAHADHVYFVCSDGSNGQASSVSMVTGKGNVCGGNSRPNIMIQSGTNPEQTTILEVDPDEPADTFNVVLPVLKKHRNDQCIVDITGGTKSMAAGLYSAGAEFRDINFTIVTGYRSDLHPVTGTHSYATLLKKNVVFGKRRMIIVQSLIRKQDYESGIPLIENLFRTEGFGSDKASSSKLNQLYYFCKAFSAWDNFDYAESRELLESYIEMISSEQKKVIADYKSLAKRLAHAVDLFYDPSTRRKYRKGRQNMYLIIYDLIRNAKRKAAKGHFDDAVARLYRATEMYAQVTLMQFNIDTSDVDIARVAQLGADKPVIDELKRKASENGGKVQIPLQAAYQLLADLHHPIGNLWKPEKDKITDSLTIRNYSLLAHGIRHVSTDDYEKVSRIIIGFLQKCDDQNKELAKSKIKLENYMDLPNQIIL
ncbi:TIGR02710 family CRISPR-associated CARF protein [Sporolactobacillus sp. Y61]|uniref:TIGR02710 family CRISPR-associated CARF protein n=1 Tax=Sporolactobacillus sp. Y61 TaxID=3160863 RepID=A0AAU8IJD9_9BACL